MGEPPWVFCKSLRYPLNRVLHVLPGRWEAMSRASSQVLVAGPLTVARTHRKVVQAAPGCRALESESGLQAGVSSAQNVCQWQQQGVCSHGSESNNGGCLFSVPSSVPTSEVTEASGGASSWTPVVVGRTHLWNLR